MKRQQKRFILSPKEAQRSTNRANNVTTTKSARRDLPPLILTQSSTRTLANSDSPKLIHHNPNRVLTNSVNDKFPESQPWTQPRKPTIEHQDLSWASWNRAIEEYEPEGHAAIPSVKEAGLSRFHSEELANRIVQQNSCTHSFEKLKIKGRIQPLTVTECRANAS